MLEAYAEQIGYFAMAFGIIMSAAIFAQTRTIYKNKSSADVSLFTWAICFPGFIGWLIYGLAINSMPLVISNIVALIAVTSVVIEWFIYRK